MGHLPLHVRRTVIFNRHLQSGILLCCVLILLTSGPAWGVGTLEGLGFYSSTVAVSRDGTTVVGSKSEGGAYSLRDGELTVLATGEHTGAFDVSADGSVVVGNNAAGGVVWHNGHMTQLPALPNGDHPRAATAVSADGRTIGGVLDQSVTAFRWDDGVYTEITPNPDSPLQLSSVEALSPNGSVAVGFATNEDGFAEAMILRGDDSIRLGDLPGGIFFSGATDVSRDGSVIVGVGFDELGSQAVRWENGVMEGLGRLPDRPEGTSFADSVSGDGARVVGFGCQSTCGAIWRGGHAFYWSAQTGMVELELVLEAFGIDIGDWHLAVAADLSDDGRVIVGIGINPMGYRDTWIATLPHSIEAQLVPEPSTLMLLGIGLALVGAARRRR